MAMSNVDEEPSLGAIREAGAVFYLGHAIQRAASSDALRFFRRKPVRTSSEVDALANEAGVVLDMRQDEQAFELPGRLFEQLPFAVYVCDRDGLILRYNRRAAQLWGRSPKLGDPDERF
ncbi:PAS domain-containing protein [Bradyrhizobium sp. AUGA SZCCT0177]|uniref:PAS domain-containing protein n=1 Tax=Bradyrhizobium sp. AUGA SZCCT0177 TaxID=2807665 RepID=UPI001BA78F6D|nr:PAS domain-containing protein [Bradyrhizobium sp. AUGA SZCCT0177]MBR1287138.1 PAS domain-containing protein [Bradyrhizobium sp. AUGA SZCCT0177]